VSSQRGGMTMSSMGSVPPREQGSALNKRKSRPGTTSPRQPWLTGDTILIRVEMRPVAWFPSVSWR
jgi:hypothetical protein